MSTVIQELEREFLRTDIPSFSPGDTVCVWVKVLEGTRERLQAFEGTVIAIKNRGIHSSFTVRKVSHGEGVERVFQTHSTAINNIEVKRYGKVRRAKLYYLRDLAGRAGRIREDLSKMKRENKGNKENKESKETPENEVSSSSVEE